jgi:hypothetical protein
MGIFLEDREEADATFTVTSAARETLVLRAFARLAIPMLDNPNAYPGRERRQLAASLRRALEGRAGNGGGGVEDAPPYGDADAPPEEGYEPGMDCP